ncbi:hypothetical protein KJ966_20755 [bacterium]|nr:hypothetical protein [bacterium]
MNQKLKSKSFLILLVVLAFLASQCFAADPKIKKKDFKLSKDFGTELLNLKIDDETMYVLPRPMIIFQLLSKSDLELGGIVEVNTETRYLSETTKALNLGARCADGISLMYGSPTKEQQRDLGVTLMKLTKSLELTRGLEKEINELQQTLKDNNQKEAEKKIDDIFASAEILFNQRKNKHLAVSVSLGGWIEALYISTSSLMKNYDADASKVLTQGNVIEVYIRSLDSMKDLVASQPVLKKIAAQLPKIKGLVTTDDEPITRETIAQLHQIAQELKKAVESN